MFSRFFKSGSDGGSIHEKKGDVTYNEDVETSWPKTGSDQTPSPTGEREEFVEPDAKELRRLMWKIDLRIIPFVALLYLCSFLDRVNIGNAKIAGMMDDMDISEGQYNWALSIFFIGYVLFEVPSNLMLKVVGPRLWITAIMLIWGAIMAAMAKCRNGSELMAARFFLGVAESGLYPGIIFYLTVWYTKKQQSLRIALFYGSSTLAGAFGGILAYGIVHMDGLRGLRGWQWIFIIEAIPTLLLGALTYVVLPDYPETTTFLNEREREIILQRNRKDAGVATETHFTWKQVGSTCIDWKIYAYSAVYMAGSIPVYSLSMFMPSIVRGMGYESITAQAMSSPPYACAFVWCVFNAWDADRRGERGFHLSISACLAVIGYALLIGLKDQSSGTLYVGAIFAAMGSFGMTPVKTSWFSNNFGGHTRRSVAIALITSIGNTSGAIAGQVYRATDAPQYIKGHTGCLALVSSAVVTSIILKFIFYRINKKRDNMTPEEYRIACEGEDLGEKHPGFRYIL